MIDIFTCLYSLDIEKNFKVLKAFRFNSLLRLSVRVIANVWLPIYFRISKRNFIGTDPQNRVIVSMTTFPARIDRVWMVVETLLRQSKKPGRIILWLSKDQFGGTEDLPKKLIDQTARGLEIFFREGDLRSHKKYFYTVKEFPGSPFIIVDDDTFYPSNLLKNLLSYGEKYPDSVCFNRGYQVGIGSDGFHKYKDWRFLKKSVGPKSDIMPTGVGGVYYPSHVLHPDVICDNLFMEYCKYADDIWLYAMVLYANNKLVKTNDDRIFIPVINKSAPTLTRFNVAGNGNDVQLAELDRYYKEEVGVKLFNIN